MKPSPNPEWLERRPEIYMAMGLTAPMAECAREIFHDTVARGFAEEDDAAVLKRYAEAWGASIP